MKRLLSVLAIILFSGIGMIGAQDLCKGTGGYEAKLNEVSTINDTATVTLYNYQPYQVDIIFHIYDRKTGNVLSKQYRRTVPAAKGENPGTRKETIKANQDLTSTMSIDVEVDGSRKCN